MYKPKNKRRPDKKRKHYVHKWRLGDMIPPETLRKMWAIVQKPVNNQ